MSHKFQDGTKKQSKSIKRKYLNTTKIRNLKYRIPLFVPPKNKKPSDNLRFRGFKVPQTGLEPVRPCGHRILSPACLPIPPPGRGKKKEV